MLEKMLQPPGVQPETKGWFASWDGRRKMRDLSQYLRKTGQRRVERQSWDKSGELKTENWSRAASKWGKMTPPFVQPPAHTAHIQHENVCLTHEIAWNVGVWWVWVVSTPPGASCCVIIRLLIHALIFVVRHQPTRQQSCHFLPHLLLVEFQFTK